MHLRATIAIATTLILSAPALGCSTMCPAPAATPAPAAAAAHTPRPPGHVYQLDFALSPGGAYTLLLEEDRGGDIRVGANIPLSTTVPMSPRQDVGLNLHCNFATIGDDLVVHTGLEMSFVDEQQTTAPAAIHKISSNGDALVSPGKPTLISSIEDPMSHKRYQLTVTATKLR
jgi:hydrogenase maturation factor